MGARGGERSKVSVPPADLYKEAYRTPRVLLRPGSLAGKQPAHLLLTRSSDRGGCHDRHRGRARATRRIAALRPPAERGAGPPSPEAMRFSDCREGEQEPRSRESRDLRANLL